MILTKRKPVTVGELLMKEFASPMGLTQAKLRKMTGLPREQVRELCCDRLAVTVETALLLARVFGNSADFWINTQRRTDLWKTGPAALMESR